MSTSAINDNQRGVWGNCLHLENTDVLYRLMG